MCDPAKGGARRYDSAAEFKSPPIFGETKSVKNFVRREENIKFNIKTYIAKCVVIG